MAFATRDIRAVILLGIFGYALHTGLSVNSGLGVEREVKVTSMPMSGRSPAAMQMELLLRCKEPQHPPADIAEEESKTDGLPHYFATGSFTDAKATVMEDWMVSAAYTSERCVHSHLVFLLF